MVTKNNKLEEGIDVSIPQKNIESLKMRVSKSPRLQERLRVTNELLEEDIRKYADLCSDSNAKISVKTYLENHPEIIEKHSGRTVKRWGLEWTEGIRKNNDYEGKFLENACDIYGGRFGEIFQTVVVLRDNRLKKYVAASARADGVDEKDIKKSMPKVLPFNLEDADSVIFVHNHPDRHRDTKVSHDYEGETVGYVSANGFSKKDILLTDKIYDKIFKGKCKTSAIVIGENGLTYTYEAGTSKRYKLKD